MRLEKQHISLAFFAILLALGKSLSAQITDFHGARITVENTGGLVVNGDLDVLGDSNDSTILINDGEVILMGDLHWDTTGYARLGHGASGQRAVKFVGDSSNQRISGRFKINDMIYNLVIDKDTATVLQLADGINVDGSVVWGNSTVSTTYSGDTNSYNMGGGIIDVGDNELYIMNDDIGALAGYQTPGNYSTIDRTVLTSTNSGGLRREVAKGLTYDFPVSRGNRYNPVTLDVDNSSPFTNASSDVLIRFEPYQGATVNFSQFLITNCDTGGRDYVFDCIMPNGVWRIEGSDNGKLYYRPFTYPHEENFAICPLPGGTVHTYRTLRSPNPGGDYTSFVNDTSLLNADDICLGYDAVNPADLIGQPIPGGTYKNFSSLSVGSGPNNSTPLPVELLSLDANPIDNQFIRVDWATAVEINNAGFTVQRSTDGVNFTDLGWVDGNGNSTSTHYYEFDDLTAQRGQLYLYRLEQKDFDGTISYTYMVSAMLDPIVDGLVISDFIPNPAVTSSALMVDAPYDGPMILELYNAVGQIVRTFEYDIKTGSNLIDVDVEFLASATYYARIEWETEVHDRILIVTRK